MKLEKWKIENKSKKIKLKKDNLKFKHRLIIDRWLKIKKRKKEKKRYSEKNENNAEIKDKKYD